MKPKKKKNSLKGTNYYITKIYKIGFVVVKIDSCWPDLTSSRLVSKPNVRLFYD